MIHPLPFTEPDLRAFAARIGVTSTDQAAEELARAIACSPGWGRIPGCSLLVRRAPATIALVGNPDASQLAEIRTQALAASRRVHSFRFVSYSEAEAACEALASRLSPLLEAPEWADCRFHAIPRGGHIVLGMLATLLSLPHRRLEPCVDARTPLVLIDDCVLTGSRLRQQLRNCPAERVLAAHLYSHPALREAVMKAEPRVVDCIAAHDLASGPDEGPAAGPWPQLTADAYWRGNAEFVAFAWNEPDRTVAGGEIPAPVGGWKLLPPQRCLKNRLFPSIPVLLQRTGKPPIGPSPTTLFVEGGETVTLTATSGGEILQLEGAAAAAWKALLETGELSAVEKRLAHHYEVDAATLHRDLEKVWLDLRQRGFVSEANPARQRSDPGVTRAD
ncbi:MAG: PqqD family protein [Actinomycetota bacterium]